MKSSFYKKRFYIEISFSCATALIKLYHQMTVVRYEKVKSTGALRGDFRILELLISIKTNDLKSLAIE